MFDVADARRAPVSTDGEYAVGEICEQFRTLQIAHHERRVVPHFGASANTRMDNPYAFCSRFSSLISGKSSRVLSYVRFNDVILSMTITRAPVSLTKCPIAPETHSSIEAKPSGTGTDTVDLHTREPFRKTIMPAGLRGIPHFELLLRKVQVEVKHLLCRGVHFHWLDRTPAGDGIGDLNRRALFPIPMSANIIANSPSSQKSPKSARGTGISLAASIHSFAFFTVQTAACFSTTSIFCPFIQNFLDLNIHSVYYNRCCIFVKQFFENFRSGRRKIVSHGGYSAQRLPSLFRRGGRLCGRGGSSARFPGFEQVFIFILGESGKEENLRTTTPRLKPHPS